VACARRPDWRGAFVIGLAGTILVTGIAPVMVTSLGAAGIPVTVFITIDPVLLRALPEVVPRISHDGPSRRGVIGILYGLLPNRKRCVS
jgi:hypothetical protein